MTLSPAAFIRSFLAVSAFLLALVAAMNFFVDPAGIFFGDSSLERAMAEALRWRPVIVVNGTYDERKFEQYRITFEDSRPAVIVSGSSRSALIGTRTYPEPVLNLSVSGASIEDHVALLSMALAKFEPRKVILCLDPWILNLWAGQTLWTSLQSQYVDAEAGLLPPGERDAASAADNSRYLQLVHFGYTLESIRKLRLLMSLARGHAVDVRLDDTPLPARDLLRRDGSRVYSLRYLNRRPDEADQDIDHWVQYSLAQFSFSAHHRKLLTALVVRLQQCCTVEFFLAPYHPIAYARLKVVRPEVMAVEAELRMLAQQRHIRVMGSYDPAQAHCTRDEFFDGAHAREVCLQRILETTP